MLPAVLVLTLSVIPLATARWWLAFLFVLPLLALLWVRRVGVDVDPDAVTVRAVLGRRRIAWADVAGLQAGRRGDLWLVLRGAGRLRLPVVRARHLPLLAAASGGRIPDPAAPDPTAPDPVASDPTASDPAAPDPAAPDPAAPGQ
jgi:hypothetical protein